MRPPFPLKEIALQSGLSLATVDRALHGRGHVAKATDLRIAAAIADLERQYAEARIGGRRLVLDVVMETPQRFSNAVRAAFEAELPGIRPATISARYHLAETISESELLAILKTIRRRGSHGVVLKVPSTPAVAEMAAQLLADGIPVVTLVTDLPAFARTGYVGMDNRMAGATVAYLLARMAGPAPGTVLLTLSSARFSGEEERERGFRTALSREAPQLQAATISEGFGVDRTTGALVRAALADHPDIRAVYSIGGGNRAILKAFAEEKRRIDVIAAHDLDSDNRTLLSEGKLTFVIHHDLRQDARSACQMMMVHHRMLPQDFSIAPSRVAVATPYEGV
ncbi:LacI family DNA-binding transcriptional regulator [Peteryoungia ipomoeae]|uniref:LacI family DNA-binding transcriptional regulator n=1 Tax=Peteryoungia ipomoeae TaxID=1210932 RepID=A0A4S8NZ48_9HYPH|nr:LacI family DNA-binding transcriptional regulator [Peteryoungia ipomoeae]THV22980.1 LacI family DNA-binding transcriptional regulator [Peteryoungia ipomoeae]